VLSIAGRMDVAGFQKGTPFPKLSAADTGFNPRTAASVAPSWRAAGASGVVAPSVTGTVSNSVKPYLERVFVGKWEGAPTPADTCSCRNAGAYSTVL
jgi:hypothetical protein